ncbi:MAG: hypothetical protein GY859_18865 [Desulfobacterales bacterium]|nr:hypothetical protein [Desulfobacterales bacterium]
MITGPPGKNNPGPTSIVQSGRENGDGFYFAIHVPSISRSPRLHVRRSGIFLSTFAGREGTLLPGLDHILDHILEKAPGRRGAGAERAPVSTESIEMKNIWKKLIVLAVMLIGLPLLGVVLAGLPAPVYLEFPPRTRYTPHAPLSWTAFFIFTALILLATLPPLFRGFRAGGGAGGATGGGRSFPWWGWAGICLGVVSWALAWTRFSWFSTFQRHTFTPLWLSFILVINAVDQKRTGGCLMTRRPLFFLLLFPVSAAFWWFFEYLNRFVQNWFYSETRYGPWGYFIYATLPFATVLPAVLSVREWIRSAGWMENAFRRWTPIRLPRPGAAAGFALAASGLGLLFIGVAPDYLFPLLWVSPLMILVSLQALMGERHALSDISGGDWTLAVSSALAALFCGFFWEMWNFLSLARWEYSVPFVHRWTLFEMPLLGYAGYLPFGIECTAVGMVLEKWGKRGEGKIVNG